MKRASTLSALRLLFCVAFTSLLACQNDDELTDPSPDTPALSFTLQGKKYSYISNGMKDVDGKVLDAFGYIIVKNKEVANYKTHIEVTGSSNGEALHFIAEYKSALPLEGDSVYYSLTVGTKIYLFRDVVTLNTGKNYISYFNGKTAGFYKGEFQGEIPFFTELGTVQKIKIDDGTFLVTKSQDQ